MILLTTQLFPLWALLITALAVWQPGLLDGFAGWIVPLLMLIMFAMGMTLTWQDFVRVIRWPRLILLGVGLQYLIMPAVAFAIGHLLQLPMALIIGLVIVGACPGGTASNVICYLARADVALSVSVTFVSTLAAVAATPFLTWLYLGQSVPVPVWDMLLSLVQIVFVPVLLGTLINTVAGERLAPLRQLFPLLSVSAIVLVIGIIVSLNAVQLLAGGLIIATAVVLHNVTGLSLGYGLSRLLGFPRVTARTLAIEVGMQNSGLGVALAAQYFSPLAALPGALFSIWHNLSGALLAWYWRRKDERQQSSARAGDS